jgi:hypothetical protein
MTVLNNYHQFEGVHYETGTVHNFYNYMSVIAPHTNRGYSEALLMGISGGITFGYFTFAYQGHDPQCNILTRNTFDPLDTLFSRLGVSQNLMHTSIEGKSVTNLITVLESGSPAIVWADKWSLPYNALPKSDQMWGAMPIIVYGYDEPNNLVHIADGSQVPLTCTIDELAIARGRVKKYKNRVLTISPPNPDKLVKAVKMGIWDTIKIFTELPPKGSKNNFGLTGLQYWAKMLSQPNQKNSWEKVFSPGRNMFAGLISAYDFAFLFEKSPTLDGERNLFAQFLEEAAVLLENAALNHVANLYKSIAKQWKILSELLLPPSIPEFWQARTLLHNERNYFITEGNQDVKITMKYHRDINQLKDQVENNFPLSENEIINFRIALSEQIETIHQAEETAISELKQAMS